MPRSSPFAITLSSAEEAEVRRRARKYTLPYSQVQRAKMILYAAEGMPNDVISADEKTSIQARPRKHATQICRPRTRKLLFGWSR